MKFPKNSEVLERYFFIRDQDSSKIQKKKEIAAQIYDEIDTIYCKVPCVMKTKRFCLDQICNLYNDWDRLRRNELTASEKSISKFLKVLEKTCNLVGKNAIHEIKTDKCRDKKRKLEDETFVKDQVTTRIGKFWTSDSKYDSKINAKIVREEKYCPKTQVLSKVEAISFLIP